MEILYADEHLVVCVKPAGMNCEADGSETDLLQALREQTGAEGLLVHRLDKATGGVMVVAKTPEAAAALSAQIQQNVMHKTYRAVVFGALPPEDTWEDLLFRDARKNKSYVVQRERKGVKKAKLAYRVSGQSLLPDGRAVSFVEVTLFTGRTHQIRVQFSSRQHPLLGDEKYGGRLQADCPLALWSTKLTFFHPVSGEKMTFCREPADFFPWNLFAGA